jgi:small-conductance mechanosensitive channel
VRAELEQLWDDTKANLGEAYRELLEFAIGALEAVLILVLATYVARWFRGRARRALARHRLQPNVEALVLTGVTILTYAVAVTFALGLLGANWTALLALLSVGTLALSLALQDVLKNFVAGIYLLVERPFSIGDRVRVRDVTGTVETIEFRTTALRDENEERVIVPNATIFAEIIVNRSAYDVAHTTFQLSGIGDLSPTLADEVQAALSGMTGLRDPGARVELVSSSVDGSTASVSVWHDVSTSIVPETIARLRARFPDAAVSVGDG